MMSTWSSNKGGERGSIFNGHSASKFEVILSFSGWIY